MKTEVKKKVTLNAVPEAALEEAGLAKETILAAIPMDGVVLVTKDSKPLTHQQPTTNRAFQEMRKSALDRLADRVPEELSARTGIPFDRQRQVFSLSSLGRNMEIDYPGYEIRPAVDDWHHLLILHYLDLADGTPL